MLENKPRMIKAERLSHGCVIANYRYTAACRHCMFASLPKRIGGYIGEEAAVKLCAALRSGGYRPVHIGGCEPFLDIDDLVKLVRIINGAGITIE